MFNNKVFFEKINNKNIFCVLSEPEINNKQVVIMSHGFRGSSIGPARTFVDFARILNSNGISTLRFDQPSSGNSEGDYLESSFNEWIDTTTYFAKKYLDLGYKVSLLGQSMGGATTIATTAREDIKNKIPCIILWSPGVNDIDFKGGSEEIFEEGGQIYKGKFWIEAQRNKIFKCLEEYQGKIHLVYGESDKFISQELRDKAIQIVKEKGQPFMILKGQDHSSWEFEKSQEVFKEELELIKSSF